MSDSPASTVSQQSLPLQAQSKTQNVVRKPMRRPVAGSVSSLPASPQINTVPSRQELESPAPELAGPFGYGTMQPVMSSSALHEPMSQRSSISESPSYTGAQEHNAFASCRLCNHCRSGRIAKAPRTRGRNLMVIRDTVRSALLPMQILPVLFLQQLPRGSSFQSPAIVCANVVKENTARYHEI